MYQYDDDYPMYKNVQFEGEIIAFINEDACLTAVIKVLDIDDNTGIKKGDIRLLKFNTWLYDNDDSALPLYDVHFLFQMTEEYGFQCRYDTLIGKRFKFYYTGKHVELKPGLYQYRFISAIPIDDISSENTDLNNDTTNDDSSHYNTFRDNKAHGTADVDSSHSIHVDQNMKSLINALSSNDSGDING